MIELVIVEFVLGVCILVGLLLFMWDNRKRIDKLEEKMTEAQKEDCPVCHGAGATTDHHDPCTECGGTGKVG